MTVRTLQQLQADCETPETMRSALDALAEIAPKVPQWAATVRGEFTEELRLLESKQQGSLF